MSRYFLGFTNPLRRSLGAVGILAGLWVGGAGAANFVEPAVFASSNGVLDILMIARPKPIPGISFSPPGRGGAINPTGWVHEICKRPASASASSCPAGSGTAADYGGARLALQPGDTLKVRLINKLPSINPEKLRHVMEPGQTNLKMNPTNLHTHGLLTPARAATTSDPTFGDFPFVSVFNHDNGYPVPQTTHQHGPIVMDSVDYTIPIPQNHPTGLFWFHPHIHGIALNQLSQGLAGIITIGDVGNNVKGDTAMSPWSEANVRHLILKDAMVLKAGMIGFDRTTQPVVDGEILHQEDPAFCAQFPAAAAASTTAEDRRGFCPGVDNTPDGNDYTGGKWYFTVSGQQYPTLQVKDLDGEIWRLTNASGSVSYDLQLVDDATNRPIVMQLVAVDGVSIHLPQDTPMGTVVKLAGGKFKVVACPPAPTGIQLRSLPVCVSELVMMPSARAELWVTYRDSNGRIAVPPAAGATAKLKMVGLTMGAGDAWPAVDLASVVFAPNGPRRLTSYALDVQGDAFNSVQPSGIFAAAVPNARMAAAPAGCKPLAAGHRRRIFFGFSDVTVNNTFALGYEELDPRGNVVAGTATPMKQFDPAQPTICLPLGPGQTPVHETWELVQLSTENHNFHVHQTRFRRIEASAPAKSLLSARTDSSIGAGIVQDNLPLGVATPTSPAIADKVSNLQNGVCTMDQWRSGECASTPVVLDIPFPQLGEFVYHCHILEHEDGGMMARIQVVPSAN
jgi:L-ascorbate oxidase